MLNARLQFERDYEQYADAIFRYLYFRLQDRERALELTQDVFARFWQQLNQGKTVEYPKAFLYRSAKNAFINEIRTDKKTASLDKLMEAGLEIAQDTANLEILTEQKEVVEKLKNINNQYRDVLVMRFIEDMPVKEIAKILGKRENTVSVWIKRGLEKFRKLYE